MWIMRRMMSTTSKCTVVLSATLLCALMAGCVQEAPPPAQPITTPAVSVTPAPTPEPVEPAATSTIEPAEPAAIVPHVAEPPPAPFYTVGHYDKQQDPAADLAATIVRAKAEHKRIILQIGGDWCVWCGRISDYMQTNERVRQLLDEHFVVMKVTDPGDNAESFLSQYPSVNAYPHFFVLEPDGTFLHSQGTGELEHEKSYDEEVFCQFLNEWAL